MKSPYKPGDRVRLRHDSSSFDKFGGDNANHGTIVIDEEDGDLVFWKFTADGGRTVICVDGDIEPLPSACDRFPDPASQMTYAACPLPLR